MIVIKGMRMPKNCSDCDLCRGHICKITGTDIVANPKGDCPLVEIVTCKDCVKGQRECSNSKKYCMWTGRITEDDFFCADAERRE